MKRIFLSLIFLVVCIYSHAVIQITGPSEAEPGSKENVYYLKTPDLTKNTFFKIQVTNGTLKVPSSSRIEIPKSTTTTAIIVDWNNKVGTGEIKVLQEDDINSTATLKVTLKHANPFELDPGYSGDPMKINLSNNSPKQFEKITIGLEEHYVASLKNVDWTIGGKSYTGTNNSIYIPISGNVTISAKAYFDGTNETKTISKTINVSSGVPNLSSIKGKTGIAPGSQTSYFVSEDYSGDDVTYIWSVRYKNNVSKYEGGKSYDITFPSTEGAYMISCQAKDIRTGNVGNTVTLNVTVSSDYPATRVANENMFKFSLNSNNLEIKPTDNIEGNSFLFNICNLYTGKMEVSGQVDSSTITNVDLSYLQKGIYVIYIIAGNEKKESYKFIIK